jgi:hypothetical protein
MNSIEDLLTGIYAAYDLVSEPEKDAVNRLDDKFVKMGNLSPADIKFLKKLLREVKTREKG